MADSAYGGLETPLTNLRFPKWQGLCKAALVEPDPEKLFLRVIVAETAIFHRLRDATGSPDDLELRAMGAMLKNLQRLIENVFMFPASDEFATKGTVERPEKATKPNRTNSQTQLPA